MNNMIRLHCIVCNIQFSTEKEVQQHQNLAGVCRELWNVFIKCLKLRPSSSWNEILDFCIQSNQVPFCSMCRNLVTQMYLCYNKKTKTEEAIDDRKDELDRLIQQISRSTSETFRPEMCVFHDDHYDDAKEEDKKISIMLKVMDLRKTICDNYNSTVDPDLPLTTCTSKIQEDVASGPSTGNDPDITTTTTTESNRRPGDMGGVIIKTEIKSEESESIFNIEQDEPIPFQIKTESAAAVDDHTILENMIETKQEQQLQCANCYEHFITWKSYYSHCQTCQMSGVTEGDDDEESDFMSTDPLELHPQNDNLVIPNHHHHSSTTTTASRSSTTLQSTKCTKCPGCAVTFSKPKPKKSKLYRVIPSTTTEYLDGSKSKQNPVIPSNSTEYLNRPTYVIIAATTPIPKNGKRTIAHVTQERDRRLLMAQDMRKLQGLVPYVRRLKNASKFLILNRSREFVEYLMKRELSLIQEKMKCQERNESLKRQAVRLGLLKPEINCVRPQYTTTVKEDNYMSTIMEHNYTSIIMEHNYTRTIMEPWRFTVYTPINEPII